MRSKIECAIKCTNLDGCQSFDVDTARGICYLYSSAVDNCEGLVTDVTANEVVYFEQVS